LTIERRTDERLHASLPARVAFGGRYRLRGVVLNISGTGAKLALDKSGDVPAEFVLSVCFKRQERHYKAKIQWRKREALGLGLRPLPAADSEWLQGLARTRRSEDAVLEERRTRLLHLANESERI
jgi:PilZ domain